MNTTVTVVHPMTAYQALLRAANIKITGGGAVCTLLTAVARLSAALV